MNFYRLLFLTLILLLFGGCYPLRSVWLVKPDKKDLNRFEHTVIDAGEDCFEFHPSNSAPLGSLKINDWTRDIPFFIRLDSFVTTHATRSMLIIQNDTLKYQYYSPKLTENDLHSSYSIAKSFTSALVGIAIEEGYVGSEHDLVAQYVDELKDVAYADKLTIAHLLNHTSGIRYKLATDATIYYGRNSLKALKNLQFEAPPGTRQHYLNVNVEILGLVLKRATGIAPSQYLSDKIWQPIGMCHDGIWSVDERNQQEKTFCCMGATALDYAKFGRLYLQKGSWNGKQVIPASWYEKSICRDTTEGSSFNYQFGWHIGLEEYGDFMAIGLYKQHIYIHPKKNLIIVLLNDRERPLKAERANWWNVFRQIADML